jgi:CHAT domain-containing protein
MFYKSWVNVRNISKSSRFYSFIISLSLVFLFVSCTNKPKPVLTISTSPVSKTSQTSNSSDSKVNLENNLTENTLPKTIAIDTPQVEKKEVSQKEETLAKALKLEKEIVQLFKNADYSKALLLAKERNDLLKDLPELEGEYSSSLNDLGAIYRTIGDYKNAEVFLAKSLEIREKLFGANSDQVAQALNNIAGVYRFRGEYEKAEKSYSRSVAIREKVAPNNLNTVKSIFNLGHFYHVKGDYDKAEPLYLRSLELIKKINADEVELANLFHNLGQIAKDRKNYNEAENYYLQAISIREKKLNPDHPLLAFSRHCLAEIEKFKGNYKKAEELHLQAIEVYEKKGLNNLELFSFLKGLGEVYIIQGNYKKAEEILLHALNILEEKVGKDHLYITGISSAFVNLYQNTKDIDLGLKYQTRLDQTDEENLLRNIAGGSERQKLAYLERDVFLKDTSISFHIQSAPTNLKASQTALSTILRRKGRALDVLAQNIELFRQKANAEDQKLLDSLAEKKKLYSNLSLELTLGQAKPESLEKIKLEQKELAEEIDKLESKISEHISEFRSQAQKITLENIQQSIPNDSVLIEFATYCPYDFQSRKFSDSQNYVAYILNNKGDIKFVDLGDVSKIDKLVNELRLNLRDKKRGINKYIKPKSQELYKIVMSPILKLTNQAQHLLLSPDGILNLLPFATLIDEKGKYLVAKNSLTYLTSGRDLLKLQIKSDLPKRSLIVADPDFGVVESSKDLFNRLPETEKEAEIIRKLVPESDLLTKGSATETALKQVKKPKILHIATHGFFFSEEDVKTNDESLRIIKIKRSKEITEKQINPLLRSGLALSGANLLNSDSGENGILTSLEVAGLDLWGTKLVVLSACDTGVGEVKSGDGVYGLRRALILSGAETQLISLWPVSDIGTRDLMSEYYRFLQMGEGRSEALRKVQLKMLKDPKRNHPFYWASFIPSGQWEGLSRD